MVKAWHMIAAAALAVSMIALLGHAEWWNAEQLSEHGNLSLFVAGIAGVAIGRRSSRIRRSHKPDTSA